ncbi:MAG: hypothetical protein WCL02_03330 [bacterium]
MHKFFPTLTYHAQIDTMPLAQTIVHYAQSYALEVLIENLKSEKLFTSIFNDEHHGEEKSHDAFFDTKNSNKLFLYFVKYLYELIKAYPNIIHIINKTEGIWKEILELHEYQNIPQVSINFPPLQRIMGANTSMSKTAE